MVSLGRSCCGHPNVCRHLRHAPIAEALAQKGVGLGTALTFMMAVTALSLPSMILLKRVVKLRLLAVFIGIVTVGIILIGLVFNETAHLFV